jgi:hypothetical protein
MHVSGDGDYAQRTNSESFFGSKSAYRKLTNIPFSAITVVWS